MTQRIRQRLGRCHCCSNPFDKLRCDVAEVGELAAGLGGQSGIVECDSLLSDVKTAGRDMLVGLQQAFAAGEVPQIDPAFERSVTLFGSAIERLASTRSDVADSGETLERMQKMKAALEGLVESSREFVEELEAQAPQRRPYPKASRV
ncbi:MAG: hypothetical protein KDK07_01965 [Bauldia sp.]|nr:hypothetical protein [Bauldia sp.]